MANVAYALDMLGQCYEAENEGNMALESYRQALECDSTCASAAHNMGLLYMKSAMHHLEINLTNSVNFFNAARGFIIKALKICPANPVFLHSIASWYEQYINVLEKAVGDDVAVQKNIVSNFDYAIEYYQKALSLCKEQDAAFKNIIISNLTECLAQYGHHWYKNDNYSKAQAIYIKALNFDSEHLVVINQIGMTYFKLGSFPVARKYFSSILDKTEDHQEIADAWLNIACSYRVEQNWEEAGKALNQAKRFAPEDTAIFDEENELTQAKLASIYISSQAKINKNMLFSESKNIDATLSALPMNHGAKLYSGSMHRWPFSKPNTAEAPSEASKDEELRPNSFKPR